MDIETAEQKQRVKEKLDLILVSLLGSTDMVNLWWLTNNKAFDGFTPAQMYKKDPMRVVSYILAQLEPEW